MMTAIDGNVLLLIFTYLLSSINCFKLHMWLLYMYVYILFIPYKSLSCNTRGKIMTFLVVKQFTARSVDYPE